MDKMLKTIGGIGLILGLGFIALKFAKDFSRKRKREIERLLKDIEEE